MAGTVDIRATLTPKLSSDANIYLAGDKEFSTATAHWSQYKAPVFTAVVEPATEGDVVETVKYANAHNIPFHAYNGGHGCFAGLEAVQNGIQIKLKRLNSVTISNDEDIATCGGGIIGKTLVDALWKIGKQTVVGGCETTSLLGPGLGGGHGFLQGKYGLISDQFVSARIVLADGSIQEVSADSGDPDLWWALQGAGHNFGLVTSISVKIYDIEEGDVWSHRTYTFTLDKVGPVYELVNKLWPDGTTPTSLINFSVLWRIPAVDAEMPVITFILLQHGTPVVDSSYSQQFDDIGPVSTQSGSGPYKELAKMTGLDESAPASQKIGLSYIRFPVNVQNYNIKAQREACDMFARVTKDNPEFTNSFFMFEGYSLDAVKAIPDESTAFPHRQDNIIIVPVVVYANNSADPELDAKAFAFGEKLRQIIWSASGQSELHAYVNYANGGEKPEQCYGYEPWRLQKLAALKKKYDPQGKFKFYAPVE